MGVNQGDVLVCTSNRTYFTYGGEYTVSEIEDEMIWLIDDDGDPSSIEEAHIKAREFVVVGSKEHDKFIEFQGLLVGDIILAKNGDKIVVADFIQSKRNNTFHGILTEGGYKLSFIRYSANDDFNLVLDKDTQIGVVECLALIDVALDKKDKEWFLELTEKLKELENDKEKVR